MGRGGNSKEMRNRHLRDCCEEGLLSGRIKGCSNTGIESAAVLAIISARESLDYGMMPHDGTASRNRPALPCANGKPAGDQWRRSWDSAPVFVLKPASADAPGTMANPSSVMRDFGSGPSNIAQETAPNFPQSAFL